MVINAQDGKSLDVFGVGNALLDILAFVEDDFLETHQLGRGGMTLMDAHQQGTLLQELENSPLKLSCGGSAANTMMAIAQSGGTGYFAAKVGSDTNGEFYRQDMTAAGIEFGVKSATEEQGPTGTCLVLTTPDAERTLCTNLGVSIALSPADIDWEALRRSKYVYVEGYLWDAPEPRLACLDILQQAQTHNIKVALTFSDLFLVERHGEELRQLSAEYADVIFCNADEVKAFCQETDLEACARQMSSLADLIFITNGGQGCLVVQNQTITPVSGFPVKPIDTVGAGDAFAGGVLYGLTNGLTTEKAARWGNYLGSQIVQVRGPRLSESYRSQLEKIISR